MYQSSLPAAKGRANGRPSRGSLDQALAPELAERTVLLLGSVAASAGELAPALRAAGARGVRVSTAKGINRVLDDLGQLPACLIIDGEQAPAIDMLLEDSRMLAVPILGRVSHPSESSYLQALRGGADDVVTLHDLGGVTRRVATLTEQSVPVRATNSQRALVADPDPRRRILHGRALRRVGMEVDFAADHDTFVRLLSAETRPDVVIAHETLVESHAWIRERLDDHVLAVVMLQEQYAGERGGHRVERTAWLPQTAPAENLLFVINELFSSASHNQRSSRRVLYATLCTFRRDSDLVPDYGVTYNISRDGIFVRTLQPLDVGASVWLEMRPPGDMRAVHLQGTVVWRRLPGGGGSSPPGFAIRVLPQLCPVADLDRYRTCYAMLSSPLGEVDDEVTRDSTPDLSAKARPRVLVADDEEGVLRVFQRVLNRMDVDVVTAHDGTEAVNTFRRGAFDAVLTDIEMPGLDGIELLKAIHAHDDQIPVLIVTGNPSAGSAIEALENGAMRYLVKPVEPQGLQQAVESALQMGRLAKFRREAAGWVSRSAVAELGAQDELTQVLDRALDQLSVHFQPIVCAAERRVVAFEALVRTTEPKIPHPGALFDAAQRLDRVAEVSRKIRRLSSEAMTARDELLFINLHPSDLLDEDLYDPDAPLSAMAHEVVLEITERASLEKVDDLRGRAKRLRELGYRIAVDDLGAGYSGLSSFVALQPDVAKVDMSLVRDIDTVPTKRRLVRSLVETCRDLGIMFVAEGVETQAELDTLAGLGCDLYQGYFFARPAPPFPDVLWPSNG